MRVLDIDYESLSTVSSDLSGAGESVTGVSADVSNLGAAEDADVQAGLDAVTVAWGTALELLGEDITFLSGHVETASAGYDGTDSGMASDIAGMLTVRGPR